MNNVECGSEPQAQASDVSGIGRYLWMIEGNVEWRSIHDWVYLPWTRLVGYPVSLQQSILLCVEHGYADANPSFYPPAPHRDR